jgi:hypothetical protein
MKVPRCVLQSLVTSLTTGCRGRRTTSPLLRLTGATPATRRRVAYPGQPRVSTRAAAFSTVRVMNAPAPPGGRPTNCHYKALGARGEHHDRGSCPHHPGRSASCHRPTVNPGPGIRNLLVGASQNPTSSCVTSRPGSSPASAAGHPSHPIRRQLRSIHPWGPAPSRWTAGRA